jgi:type VI secretion system protein ImpI
MSLVLTITNVPNLPDGGPISLTVRGERGVDIGRHPHLDWTLPDPDRIISGKHCEVRWREGGYWLHDVSTNGTFLNGSGRRMTGAHRLRDGDKLSIGRYIVAVALDGPEARSRPDVAPARVVHDAADPWSFSSDPPPAIDPRDLRVAPPRPAGADFLDWAADAPPVEPARRPMRAEPRGGEEARAWTPPAAAPFDAAAGRSGPASRPPSAEGWDDDWAPRPSPAPAPEPAPRPQPRRPALEEPFSDLVRAAMPPPRAELWGQSEWRASPAVSSSEPPAAPAAQAASPGADLAEAPIVSAAPVRIIEQGAPLQLGRASPSVSPSSSQDAGAPARDEDGTDAFLRRMARAAGVPEQALARRSWEEAADEWGALLRIVTEEVMRLMAARFEARRIARSSNQTQIQAIDNNPLKFSPTPDDALRLLFGPPTRGYLRAGRAFSASFDDLKRHQLVMFRAMQEAMKMLMEDMSPEAVEASLGEERGLASLMSGSRKARAWEIYAARWKAKAMRQEDGMLGAFMLYFSQAYDRIDSER